MAHTKRIGVEDFFGRRREVTVIEEPGKHVISSLTPCPVPCILSPLLGIGFYRRGDLIGEVGYVFDRLTSTVVTIPTRAADAAEVGRGVDAFAHRLSTLRHPLRQRLTISVVIYASP